MEQVAVVLRARGIQVALHYYCFLRASVIKNGLSRATVRELTQAMRLVGVFCIFCFCILAIASALQFTEVRAQPLGWG